MDACTMDLSSVSAGIFLALQVWEWVDESIHERIQIRE
jgi:hypothetical protein